VAPRPRKKLRPVQRQKSGVLGLLRWLRWQLPYFADVLLRDYDEDKALVTVFAVFNGQLTTDFSKSMAARLKTADGKLDELRAAALLALMRKKLAAGPKVIDVELTAADYAREELEDFESAEGPRQLPDGAFLIFRLSRKTVVKKGKNTNTADNIASDAGAPRYVIPELDAPPGMPAELKDDFDPDWPVWAANPEIEGSAELISACGKNLRPTWPKWEVLAAKLRAANLTLKDGATITADNVRRVVVQAELVLGNEKPDCVA
jgi:hypothetical protein